MVGDPTSPFPGQALVGRACAICGVPMGMENREFHAYHETAESREWAAGNRAICDFVHRRKTIPRLPKHEREDDFWGGTDVAEVGP